MRIGFSKDIHKLVPNRELVLGGIIIPSEFGEEAHSDGDVLLHAIGEAILGALALGDLGTHFPDTDDKYKDIKSTLLINEIMKMINAKHYKVNNVDAFISLETPKLKDYMEMIRASVATLLNVDVDKVSIKAGTNEKMGPVGRKEAIEAYAIVSLKRKLL